MSRSLGLLAGVWALLALATLALLVEENHALPAALTAWTGGIFSVLLYQDLRKAYLKNAHSDS